jgi:DNA polymerase I-like protein with 3'-5' exonuclease and polymerase domains
VTALRPADLGVRRPEEVPTTLVTDAAGLAAVRAALASSARLAVDTETVFSAEIDGAGAGPLRVVSLAVRDHDGTESAWVVDVARVAGEALAPLLAGHTADGWNASFDAEVLQRGCFGPAGFGRSEVLHWWDAQLADALLHAGRSGFGWYHGLAWASERYLGFSLGGKGEAQLSFTATAELSDDQVAYAAADAVVTLWVGDVLRRELAAAGLVEVAGLEMAARPFIDQLRRSGLPFDREGYLALLEERRAARDECLTRLAELTGGGQANLFNPVVEPTWNPASESQAKVALNRWDGPRVAAYLAGRTGSPRPLGDADSLSATVLGELGGPLAETLLAFRHHAKLLSAYGENLLPFLGPDGRFHPQYLQIVGANTGRLSSRNPNVLAFPPEVQGAIRPSRPGRTFVHADVSQAELRWLAQVSGDAVLAAELAGGDVHSATAAAMFGEDMTALGHADPARHAQLRARAKAINFGIVYGQGPQALARSLTLAGQETSVEQAAGLLDAYLAAHLRVTEWVRNMDRVVNDLADRPGPVDWAATLELFDRLVPALQWRRTFRDLHHRWPSTDELAVEHAPAVADVLRFEEPVVVLAGGAPFGWESRTIAGRRRLFTVATSSVLRRAAQAAAASTDVALRASFDAAVAQSGLSVPPAAREPLAPATVERLLEDRPLRRAVIAALDARVGWPATAALLDGALKQSVARVVNAHRNAPIQGGVADAMLAAYAEVWARLGSLPSVEPVATVHDSLVLECDAADADRVGTLVLQAITAAFARFCPDVPVKVSLDVRASLADADVIRPLPS